MKSRAGIPAVLLFVACTENGVVGPTKCVDVPASPVVPTWKLDRDESQPYELSGIWGTPNNVFAVGTLNVFAVGTGCSPSPCPYAVVAQYCGGTSWTPKVLSFP